MKYKYKIHGSALHPVYIHVCQANYNQVESVIFIHTWCTWLYMMLHIYLCVIIFHFVSLFNITFFHSFTRVISISTNIIYFLYCCHCTWFTAQFISRRKTKSTKNQRLRKISTCQILWFIMSFYILIICSDSSLITNYFNISVNTGSNLLLFVIKVYSFAFCIIKHTVEMLIIIWNIFTKNWIGFYK